MQEYIDNIDPACDETQFHKNFAIRWPNKDFLLNTGDGLCSTRSYSKG